MPWTLWRLTKWVNVEMSVKPPLINPGNRAPKCSTPELLEGYLMRDNTCHRFQSGVRSDCGSELSRIRQTSIG
jgi:hypothetical protein